MLMMTSHILVSLRSSTALAGPFSQQKWMHGQFLTIITSGLVGKDGKLAKLEAFLWRPPARTVDLLRTESMQLVTISICFYIIKKKQNYMHARDSAMTGYCFKPILRI